MPSEDTKKQERNKMNWKDNPMMMIAAAFLAVVGGAGGQSLFGISEDKIDSKFEQAEKLQDARMKNIETQNQNTQTMILDQKAELRDIKAELTEHGNRLTRLESDKPK